jgi:acyl transferase domain-containing protein
MARELLQAVSDPTSFATTYTDYVDPVEAEAISTAFFGKDIDSTSRPWSEPLFVGSIKTILGHTEGTAGIAAILRAVLAIQNSTIPPNLLFNSLSPSVAPFYDNLEIPRTAKAWPELSAGQPRRASVNSFGFGGANAHAIVESYENPSKEATHDAGALFTPFVFSAASEQSLKAMVGAYVNHLQTHPDIRLSNLAYTLRERRSLFEVRTSFSATDINQLQDKMSSALEESDAGFGTRSVRGGGKILGVFTGQGAQYAGMGAELIKQSPFARNIIRELEYHLSQLPGDDRPTWSLEAEILADKSATRVGESEISQPLNTAVQIMLVDLLRLAGIHFDTVVGHSGGEVAAAYAAGILTARDALCVAHYRGMNCKLARSPNEGIKGAMLAVGTTMEDAQQLCEEAEFAGRITVAAVNASNSVTISGDEDAIDELMVVMEEEKKFNRKLRVDNAYHSKHMLPAVGPYTEGVRRAGVKAAEGPTCTWYSSVFDGAKVDHTFGLSDVYWAENMVRPVLFAQAMTAALESGTEFDAVLEVGPHAALKSPATQTIQNVLKKPLPYSGTLTRDTNAIEAFSTALGFLWSRLDNSSVNLSSLEATLSGNKKQLELVKGLPSYQWNHNTKYWHESRRSRQMRLRPEPFHPLLGDASPDSGPHALRWKNILKPSEIEWVQGHSVQGQLVFPAAGYASTAFEAARTLSADKPIRLIELDNLYIHQAITFPGNDVGVEVLIELSQVSKENPAFATCKFAYSAALSIDSTDLSLAASGDLKVLFGDPSPSTLPARRVAPPHMIEVEESRLYNYMETLEYKFSGPFRSLVELKRKLGTAVCVATRTTPAESVLVHPAELDAAFQSINLAYSYPGDEQLRNLHLPTSIAKIRVNPVVLIGDVQQDKAGLIQVDSTCNSGDRSSPGSGFSGSVNMYFNDCMNAAVQVDRVTFKPVGMSGNEDRKVFCKMDFVPSIPDGAAAAESIQVTQHETDLMWCLSRIVNFYVRQFDADVPEDSPARKESPTCHYLNYIRHMRGLLQRNENQFAKQEWLNDTLEDVKKNIKDIGYVSAINLGAFQLLIF